MATVSYQVIRNFSGADTHFSLLQRALARRGFSTELHFCPHMYEIFPYRLLRPFLCHHSEAAIIHSKAEYGWLFAQDSRPLVVVLAHSVFDRAYERTKGVVKCLYHRYKLEPSIRRSFDRAQRIVTVSEFSRHCIQEKFGRRDVRMIYEGLDLDLFRPQPPLPPATNGTICLLYVGNLIPRKGFPLLAKIMEKLGKGFVLCYTAGLRARSLPPPMRNMVPLGRLSDTELVEAYNRCDIFVFPSRLEGFGRPVAEAMACGKPVVTTNYASMPELLEDERGGFLCPMDDVNSFAAKIRLLAADPELRARMGAYNRAKVEQCFSLDQWAANYLQLYQELL